MTYLLKTILATLGLLILSVLSCLADDSVFYIRFVHPDNDKIIENINTKGIDGYEKYTQESPGWPHIIWVGGKTNLNISDLTSVSVGYSKAFFSKEELKIAKKFNPNLNIGHDFEKDLTEGGQPQIEFIYNHDGKRKLAELTKNHVNQRIAIFIDGKFLSAPKIIAPITDGKAMLTTSLSIEQARNLVEKINNQILAKSE